MNVLILVYDGVMVHSLDTPGVFSRIVMYWLRETSSMVLSRPLVYMAWLWVTREWMPAQRLGGTIGPDYEWDRPRQIWVTRTKSRAGEPHARWWSLAKGHLWFIFTSPDGLHLKQRHWLLFIPGWKKCFLRGHQIRCCLYFLAWGWWVSEGKWSHKASSERERILCPP